jgi:hypothetical protein
MNDEKRKCIFTGEPANYNKTVTYTDKHNWTRKVPCTKEWWGKKDSSLSPVNGFRPLNKLEFKLVELFYEQELAKLKIANIESQMDEIRLSLQCPVVKEHETVRIDDLDISEVSKTKDFNEVMEEMDEIEKSYAVQECEVKDGYLLEENKLKTEDEKPDIVKEEKKELWD